MRAIADWLNVRVAWLRDGEGPIRATASQNPAVAEIDAMMSQASPRSQRVLQRIKAAADAGRLTEEDLEALGAIADRLEKKN